MAGHSVFESSTVEFPVSTVLRQWIRAEDSEMPGLRLTAEQAQRLWGLDSATSRAALELSWTTTQKGFFVMAVTAHSLMRAPHLTPRAGGLLSVMDAIHCVDLRLRSK